MADADLDKQYCLKPKKADSQIIFLKNNYTVGKALTCDLQLDSVEIDSLLAEFVKVKKKDGWSIINHSSSDGVSSVRVNRFKVKPKRKRGLKEGDLISFGFLDDDFEYVFQSLNTGTSSTGATTSVSAGFRFEASLSSTAGNFTIGTNDNVPIVSTQNVASAAANFRIGTNDNVPIVSTQNVPSAASGFKFGSGYANASAATGFNIGSSAKTPETAANFGFGTQSTAGSGVGFQVDSPRYQTPVSSTAINVGSTAGSSATLTAGINLDANTTLTFGSKNIKTTPKSRNNSLEVRKKLTSSKDATTTNRQKNLEKNIMELKRGKKELENQIAQMLKKHSLELREKDIEIARLKTNNEVAKRRNSNLKAELVIEKSLSQQRLNEVNQLKSELNQYALRKIRVNCPTCKKFGVNNN